MQNQDKTRISRYYDRLVEEHGYSPKACDASNSRSLETRYKVLSQVGDLKNKSVLEVGCGFGDLGVYLNNVFGKLDYLGIDISENMISMGQEKNPNLQLRHCDLWDLPATSKFDIVIAQGIFYLLAENAEIKMERMINRMYAICHEAVSFCMLSSWASKKAENEYYVDPARLLEICRNLSTSIVLRHDYLPNDVAAYLYKVNSNNEMTS